MVAHAAARVAGTYFVGDMLSYQPEGEFDGVLVIFSQCHLRYREFHPAMWKFAQVLKEGGLMVLGQMPGDTYVKEGDWDESGTWVEEYSAPFMGEMLPTLMFSQEGQKRYVRLWLFVDDERVKWECW
jgi:hypothetical protein